LGWRGFWELHGKSLLRVGTSGYYGRETFAHPVFTIGSDGKVQGGQNITTQYDGLALAADVLFKAGGFHFQGELVTQQRNYTREGRPVHDLPLGPVARAASGDAFSWAVYGLWGYRFPWYSLMPYLLLQYDDEVTTPSSAMGDLALRMVSLAPGINLHPTDAVTFKFEYSHARFQGGGTLFRYPQHNVQFQAAWAFGAQ
jgi:hypothetical protein